MDDMKKIAHGVLHGCIGKCCSRSYPSIFTRIDEEEIWTFIYGVPESSTHTYTYGNYILKADLLFKKRMFID